MLEFIATHAMLPQHLQMVCDVLAHAVACRSKHPIVNLPVYCRRGEKRSVGLATLLYHCIGQLHHVGVAVDMPRHLSSYFWYHACRGMCEQCRDGLADTRASEKSVRDTQELFCQMWDET